MSNLVFVALVCVIAVLLIVFSVLNNAKVALAVTTAICSAVLAIVGFMLKDASMWSGIAIGAFALSIFLLICTVTVILVTGNKNEKDE